MAQVLQVQPSAASLQAPAPAQAPAVSPASGGAAPYAAPQAQAQTQAPSDSNQPASVVGFPGQAVQAPLASDPWRRSQQVLNEIGALERDGSLAPEKAVELRAELQGLRGGSGLHRPSDGAHLSASERRFVLKQIKAEDVEIKRDAARSRP
jgi:hypothetical protein